MNENTSIPATVARLLTPNKGTALEDGVAFDRRSQAHRHFVYGDGAGVFRHRPASRRLLSGSNSPCLTTRSCTRTLTTWLFTMHGTTMIFLVAMPVLFGIMNYILPLQIGARDMAFPRLNAFGFWLVPFGGILLHFSFLAGGAPAVGWFAYAPLSETPYSSQLGVDYWALSLLVLGIGSVSASINFIVTVLTQRAPHMTLRRLPFSPG